MEGVPHEYYGPCPTIQEMESAFEVKPDRPRTAGSCHGFSRVDSGAAHLSVGSSYTSVRLVSGQHEQAKNPPVMSEASSGTMPRVHQGAGTVGATVLTSLSSIFTRRRSASSWCSADVLDGSRPPWLADPLSADSGRSVVSGVPVGECSLLRVRFVRLIIVYALVVAHGRCCPSVSSACLVSIDDSWAQRFFMIPRRGGSLLCSCGDLAKLVARAADTRPASALHRVSFVVSHMSFHVVPPDVVSVLLPCYLFVVGCFDLD
ncbi:hypothetical protein R1flu_008972 [Riccia fluitans]|uniref:Uncharacterized protein n=1 Tax=Riccia fluitans TaxID=41844 RepID=A0ABD1Z0R3_9MARC